MIYYILGYLVIGITTSYLTDRKYGTGKIDRVLIALFWPFVWYTLFMVYFIDGDID